MLIHHSRESKPIQERRRVIPLGFEPVELDRLYKMFQSPPVGSHHYTIVDGASIRPQDILLVNYDKLSAIGEKDSLLEKVSVAYVVAVSRGPLVPPPLYHIRGMLIAAKVFALLDKIPLSDTEDSSVPTVVTECEKVSSVVSEKETVPSIESRTNIGHRVLVVDDSAAIQKSLELNLRSLESIGEIDFADTGEMALEKAQAIHYDLIFLDVMMPGIDGYETCTKLRKLASYKKTPIIMVSGKTSPMDEVKGVIAGCTTYLTKPVQEEAFRQLGRRVLAWLADHKPS